METQKSKYNSLPEWAKADIVAYKKASKLKLLSKICEQFGWPQPKFKKTISIKRTSWTIEKCKEDALKYTSRKEWQTNSMNSYSAAQRNKWLNKCCAHMPEIKKPNNYWTFERCKEEACKYKLIHDFERKSGSAYNIARKKGWLEECCAHMKRVNNKDGYWSFERCKETSSKYKNRTELRKSEPNCYTIIYHKGWSNECFAHMSRIVSHNRYWTKERCKEEALKYNNRSAWQDGCGSSVIAARKLGCYEECCAHMKLINKPKGYWTLEQCVKEASKFKTKTEWFNAKKTESYGIAYTKGFLEECCKVFKK